MAPLILKLDNLRYDYLRVVRYVHTHGEKVAPRGQTTFEVIDATLVIRDPLDVLPIGMGRKLKPAIAAAEAIQLIGGWSQPKLLLAASENFHRFLEPDGRSFWGSYGTRIKRQLVDVERKLKEDPNTRQAVITLWDPTLDNHPGHPDYPCTVMLHFIIRHDTLQLHVTMRSSDVWLGLPYDAFQFTQLQATLARALQLELGEYHHHATSLHLYERDLEAAGNLHVPTTGQSFRPKGFGHVGIPVGEAMTRARWLMRGHAGAFMLTPSEAWYADQLATLL